jgi:hypothetical protein
MNKAIKRRWVKALRSGEYKQTKGALRADSGYCCLGVLCDLAEKEGIVVSEHKYGHADGMIGYRHPDHPAGGHLEAGVLPQAVREWAGLSQDNPEIKGTALSAWNDQFEAPFATIARLVEEEL